MVVMVVTVVMGFIAYIFYYLSLSRGLEHITIITSITQTASCHAAPMAGVTCRSPPKAPWRSLSIARCLKSGRVAHLGQTPLAMPSPAWPNGAATRTDQARLLRCCRWTRHHKSGRAGGG